MLVIAYSMSVTPSGRLLKRSAGDSDRPAIFAAQFALSHAAWLLCYPLPGQIGAVYSQSAAFAVLAVVAALGTVAASLLWPRADPEVVPHDHNDLPADHPQMRKQHKSGQTAAHAFVIDDLHPQCFDDRAPSDRASAYRKIGDCSVRLTAKETWR